MERPIVDLQPLAGFSYILSDVHLSNTKPVKTEAQHPFIQFYSHNVSHTNQKAGQE